MRVLPKRKMESEFDSERIDNLVSEIARIFLAGAMNISPRERAKRAVFLKRRAEEILDQSDGFIGPEDDRERAVAALREAMPKFLDRMETFFEVQEFAEEDFSD